MRKIGFVVPLMLAAVAVFGAAQEKKAPEAKAPAKAADAKAPAKTAEAKAPAKAPEAKAAEAKAPAAPAKAEVQAPVTTPIPWFVPAKAEELESGAKFKVPVETIRTKANMKPGERRSFILKENAGGAWIVNAVNAEVATVKQVAYDDGGWFFTPEATFEIVAVKPGRTLLEMTQIDRRNAPLRAFRCYIEVK